MLCAHLKHLHCLIAGNARAVAADGGDGDDGDELHNTSDSTSPTTATIRRRQLTNNPNTVQ